ncbi:extracellular solute-binding protein [Vallitalea pronyensis]|uniref:Extracellular solute-binding protein n=1 Tax=Vallitalea pronyensis TaxID=1348613 RepID=A0A8J8MJ43_9FIRM|nr:extracellular solute-binding protein [Vallitalea pronyensis]QUI22446.1 extracellular solute-binding protein [Vallitalea pronyensis]
MKKLCSMLVMIVLITALVGCGESADKKVDSSAADEGKITIWAWDPNFNIAIMEQAKEIYLKDNPKVEIEIVDYAKGDLEQKLHTNLASGTTEGLPDIVLIEDYNAQKYLQSYPGSFEDLTGKLKHSDFAPYKVGLMTLDEKVYGVPFDSGATGFYYRTDYLEQAGYSAADLENITWDQYIEIGKNVLDKTGKHMLALDANDGGLMRVMMNSAGSWYFDESGKLNVANNKAIQESARIYKELFDSGIAKPTSGWGEWVGALNTGDVASVTTGVWITGSVKAEASQSGLWAVAPTPRLDLPGAVNASNLGGSSWYVLSSSKSTKTAVDFLNTIYGSNVDFYQDILVNRGAVGSYIPSQSGSAYTKEDEYFGGQKVYSDFSEWMQKIPSISYGLYTYEADAAIFGVMPEIYNGGSIEEALKKAEEQVKSQMQ